MPLPWSFLLGLAMLLIHEYMDGQLPSPGNVDSLVPALIAFPIPAIFAWWVTRRRRQWVVMPSIPWRTMRIVGMVQLFTVPLAYLLFLDPGDLLQLASRWSNGSHLGEFSFWLLPLLSMEVSVVIAERLAVARTQDRLELAGNPFRMPLILFLVAPILVFAAGQDLLFQNRSAEVLFSWTSVGALVGFLLFVLTLCVLLPLLFRSIMPLSRDVPEFLLQAARSLGFPTRSVFVMHTGHRLVNAALVGPLPWPRYLILTDGILSVLDPLPLRGVVAHEVAHAKARHPLILIVWFVLVPLLLLYGVNAFALFDLESTSALVVVSLVFLVGLFALRAIAHRFEHEADQLSAEAMGGAYPTMQALQGVSQMPGVRTRATWRHPSEQDRIQNLMACEQYPKHRERFHRKGRTLRRATVTALLAATLLCVVGQWQRWPWDHAVLLLYTGQFPLAAAAIDKLPGDGMEADQRLLKELRGQVRVAREFFPNGGAWGSLKEPLGQSACKKGMARLLEGRAPEARPYLALSLLRESAQPLDTCLYLYSRARDDGEAEQAERVRKHILDTFEIDDGLRVALAKTQ